MVSIDELVKMEEVAAAGRITATANAPTTGQTWTLQSSWRTIPRSTSPRLRCSPPTTLASSAGPLFCFRPRNWWQCRTLRCCEPSRGRIAC